MATYYSNYTNFGVLGCLIGILLGLFAEVPRSDTEVSFLGGKNRLDGFSH